MPRNIIKKRIAMKKINSNVLTIVITLLLIVVVVLTSFFTRHIVRQLEEEEQKKIELWAEATRKLPQAEDGEYIGFLLKVLEDNTTIPVYLVDTDYNFKDSRNVKEPKNKEEFPAYSINRGNH